MPPLVYEAHYQLRYLDRLPLGTSYPDIVQHLVRLMGTPQLRGQAALVVDATGVGRPVTDLLRLEQLPHLYPVLITGGDTVTYEGGFRRVPKRDLVATLQVLLQDGRLKFAEELPFLDTLKAELLAFRAKINLQTGHDSYEAWRERDHDDLVLSLALAAWQGEREPKGSYGIYQL